MDEDRVRVVLDAQGVAEVTLNRPDKMNALDAPMFAAIRAAIARLHGDASVRAVVLHGAGRAFCAGLDKDSFAAMVHGGPGLSAVGDLLRRSDGPANGPQQVAWGWRTLPVPVIAAVHGVAFGGGLQVALGADIRFVHPEARLSVLEIKWGLVPDMAGCVLLTELLRPDVVRELTFTGRMVGGAEAVTLGLATQVADDPLAAARALARSIAAASPDAVRAGKRLLNGAMPVDAARVLQAESHEQQRLIGGAHQREAVLAALQGRPPKFD